MPDWLDGLIKIITFVVALYGIMSAVAAKRSAEAAEKQAAAAVTQANSAKDQARAAERQVDLMLKSMSVDHIGSAIRARRAAYDCKESLKGYFLAVESPVNNNYGNAMKKLIAAADALEDIPPVLPNNVRALVFEYVHAVRNNYYQAAGTETANLVLENLSRQADTVIGAMDVAIAASIEQLSN